MSDVVIQKQQENWRENQISPEPVQKRLKEGGIAASFLLFTPELKLDQTSKQVETIQRGNLFQLDSIDSAESRIAVRLGSFLIRLYSKWWILTSV